MLQNNELLDRNTCNSGTAPVPNSDCTNYYIKRLSVNVHSI